MIFIIVITVRRDGLLGQREVPLDRLFDPALWRRGRAGPPPAEEPAQATDQSP